jgi:hypothetical protein
VRERTEEATRALADRYEDLRTVAVRAGGKPATGLGLALLLGRGSAAWIRAWERCPSSPKPEARPDPGPVERDAILPPVLHTEVARVLAGMAVVDHEEVKS